VAWWTLAIFYSFAAFAKVNTRFHRPGSKLQRRYLLAEVISPAPPYEPAISKNCAMLLNRLSARDPEISETQDHFLDILRRHCALR
jgi:hypothetical protein